MKASRLVRTNLKNGFCGLIMAIVFLLVLQAVAVSAQELNGDDDKAKNPWQGKKGDEITFDDDTGTGNGHNEGKPGKRVGHSDDMPGRRLGHRKGENGRPGSSEDDGSSVYQPENGTGDMGNEGDKEHRRPRRPGNGDQCVDNDDNAPGRRGGPGTNWENLPGKRGGPGTSPDRFRHRRFDNDDNAPGRRGGPGTNWENLPGKRGGPGTSPDRFRHRRFDNDDNAPGRRGGPGTNWENLPGKRGGPGTSPDRRKFEGSENGFRKPGAFRHRRSGHDGCDQSKQTGGESSSDKQLGKSKKNGSNGLHIGNRKNNAGNGIKNYTGNNPGRGRGKKQ